jgi:hypothetical protein
VLAVGCLMPLLLLALGSVIGAWAAGTHGGIWGGIIGFAAGCGVLLGLLWAIEQVKERR